RRVVDNNGNFAGYITIKPEHFKWIAENFTEEQLEHAGYSSNKHKNLLGWIKNYSKVDAKKPDGW
ncbi:MAG: hypothetical protein ACXABY_13035, partial [Candidatus Thorarchaeota archaeon]